MYHRATDLIAKVKVIEDKADELQHLIDYIDSHKSVEVNTERLNETKRFLVDDIQALCRDIANDKGDRDGK